MAMIPTGALFKALTFDGISSRTYGVYITGEAAYNAPERSVEMITIPGRNGTLAIDRGRYENIEVTYPAGVFAETEAEFVQNISAFRNEICSRLGYLRLTDEYNQDEYRLAVYHSGLEVEKARTPAGEFNLVFDCKPQRFLISGETEQTFAADGTISNPTKFSAAPMLAVTGVGTVGIGSYSFTLQGLPGQETFIDCEVMEAWQISGGVKVSANDLVQYAGNEFPRLVPGANGIELGAGITKVKVTPRWWRL